MELRPGAAVLGAGVFAVPAPAGETRVDLPLARQESMLPGEVAQARVQAQVAEQIRSRLYEETGILLASFAGIC